MIVQCLARSIIEFACDGVQLGLAVHRQIGSFREVLAQQTVRVLVRAALPGAVRIAEVVVNVGCKPQSMVTGSHTMAFQGQSATDGGGKFTGDRTREL